MQYTLLGWAKKCVAFSLYLLYHMLIELQAIIAIFLKDNLRIRKHFSALLFKNRRSSLLRLLI